MADVYELLLSVNLPYSLSGAELAELRWHLGLDQEPARFVIVTDVAELVIGDDGRPEADEEGHDLLVDRPYPVLAQRGPASHVRGVLFSAMERRSPRHSDGWALTSRQEIHPDDCRRMEDLLTWLYDRALDSSDFSCRVRFYEEDEFEPVSIVDGKVKWL